MLARFVLSALAAGALVVPALAGQMMNGEEARKFVAGKVFAFTCFDGTRGAGRVLDDGGAAGAIQWFGTGAPDAPSRQYASGPRTGRLRIDQGPSVRALLQSRQEGRAQLPWFGLGHGLRLLRLPPPGRRADADGASGGPAAFAAPAGADPIGRCIAGPRRDSASREHRDRAGQIRNEIPTRAIGRRSGTAPLDRLTRRWH